MSNRTPVLSSFSLGPRCDGGSIVSTLVTLLLGAILLSLALASFIDASRRSIDHRLISEAHTQAKTILDLLAFDLRMIGSGMPLGQSDFPLDSLVLGDAALPIKLDSGSSTINFRLNPRGINATLTASFTPTAADRTFSVNATTGFKIGDTIYISDMPAGGSGGLQGVIAALTETTITVDNLFQASPAVTFLPGSIVETVSTISYDSPADFLGITWDNGTGLVTLAKRSMFSIEYRDENSAPLVLPLTAETVRDNLSSVLITVQVKAPRALSNGAEYLARAEQLIALRNIIANR